MQVEISVTITKTYGVNVADDIDFDSDDITEELLNAVVNTESINSYMSAIEVTDHNGKLLYSDTDS